MNADDIWERILNGDVSDVEEEDEDDELFVTTMPKRNVQLGCDVVTRTEALLEDIDETDVPIDETEEETIGRGLHTNQSDDYEEFLTLKNNIKYYRRPFSPPDIPWNDDNAEEETEELLSPLNYFKRYIGDSMFVKMAYDTNVYALQRNIVGYKNTNSNELQVLFALHIIIGCLNKFPRLRMYWDTVLGIHVFLDNMTRNRFFELRSNLHITQTIDKTIGCTDRLFKVRPLYNAIRERLQQLQMEKNICVDEQMVPFMGNLNIIQYVKGKPNPWGVKIFMLCGQSGMLYDFLLYQGKTTELDQTNMKKFGQGASVVLHLINRIHKPGHHLFYDNYFSSYNLLQMLKSKNILAAGTIRVNRFNKPPLLTDKEISKRPRGSSDQVVSRDGDIVLVKWLDNRTVTLASNFIGIGEEDKVKRWDKKNCKYIEIDSPEIIKMYNKSMGGVDLLDRMISHHRISIRSKKWTLRLIFHAVDLVLVNSWFEYKKDCEILGIQKKKILDLLHFRMRVADG